MRKEARIAVIIIVAFLGFLWLEKPLRAYLVAVVGEERQAMFIAGIVVRMALLVMAYLAIRFFQLIPFTGLDQPLKFKNIQATFIAVVIISIGLMSNWDTYFNAGPGLLLLFLMSTLLVGILEEFVFRGVVFPMFIRSTLEHNQTVVISAILGSFLFGAVHFVNLFSQPENVIGITSQVFFATAIGTFFCGLMVRTGNILVPSLIHVLVNFSFGTDELNAVADEVVSTQEAVGINWASVIPTTILFSFIFAGGIFMLLRTSSESVLIKLKTSTIDKVS